MHVAAILDPSAANARIHAWAEHCTWNDILALFRKLRPQEKFIDDLEGQGKMLATVDDAIGRRLLKEWTGQEGWKGLEEGIRDTIDGKWAAPEDSMFRRVES